MGRQGVSTHAAVQMWGRTIGAVALDGDERIATFEYAAPFATSGIEVSPLVMPLSRQLYRFPALPHASFHGLPGLLADSLPDRFGHALIDAWLARQGRTPESFNAIERLCYTGNRGMGALEYMPSTGPDEEQGTRVDMERLIALAGAILSERESLHTTLGSDDEGLADILRVGTSAGGARAKAVIAWNPQTHEIRSGQVAAGNGFEHWLLKFDGVAGNRDRELADPQGYGSIEYAYALMAADAGIHMMPCRILEENGRRHFMTRRFDRRSDGRKLHMQSLAALAHFDFELAGGYGYEQALQVIRRLGLSMDAIEEQFRRMAFNIVARNQDDHVKNIAFLMEPSGQWRLSPAYDVTYSYNPSGAWTATHQMTLNGKQDGFAREDFEACARSASMKRGRAQAILDEVQSVVSAWPTYAEKAGVAAADIERIERTLRRDLR